MATTTMPYAEDDKLGPIGKVSVLYDPVDLRKSLLASFAQAVNDAKQAAANADDDIHDAVHRARKALRRARAILDLVGNALPRSERKAVKRALQESRRALSAIRDHAVAPETLGQLALGDEERGTAKRVVDAAGEALPQTSEIKQLIAEAATRAAAQHEALQAALPPELDWSIVVEGIQDVYAEARRARRAAKGSTAWFHTWRRRCKELVYQLDLLSGHAGPRVAAIHAELDGVTDTLGPAVDLLMARDFVETYAQGVPADEIEHLHTAVGAQLEDVMKEARKAARDAFRQKPRKFGKRLAKAVKRDLTPADDTDHNGEIADD